MIQAADAFGPPDAACVKKRMHKAESVLVLVPNNFHRPAIIGPTDM